MMRGKQKHLEAVSHPTPHARNKVDEPNSRGPSAMRGWMFVLIPRGRRRDYMMRGKGQWVQRLLNADASRGDY